MPDTPRDHVPGYLGALGVYGLGISVAALAGGARGRRLPERYPVPDLVVGAIATHKLARILAKDSVTTPLRAPFTEHHGPIGSAEVDDTPRHEPGRHALGELLTCPFCLAPWIATSYVAGLALCPRLARAWAATFAVVGGADFLQHAWARVRTD